MIPIKSKEEIKIIKEGCTILTRIMKEIEDRVEPGISTEELNRLAERLIFKFGAKPAFKGYEDYPVALCVSINEEIVHTFPSKRVLKKGDIVSLDLGIFYKGFNNKMAITLPVGDIEPEIKRLLKVTKKALKRGIKKARSGNTFGDISNTVQRYTEDQGFSVVRDLCGHGIGRELHEEPKILNYGKRHSGPEIKEGMCFCIEPMLTSGRWEIKKSEDGFGYET